VSAATALSRLAKCSDAAEVLSDDRFVELTGWLPEFDARGLANSFWAFATLGYGNPPLLHAIARQSLALIHDFSAQGLSNTAWSLATLSFPTAPLLKAISACALPKIN